MLLTLIVLMSTCVALMDKIDRDEEKARETK